MRIASDWTVFSKIPYILVPMIQGKSILLVEDSFDNRLLLSRMLKSAGVQVEFAEDGQAAIEKTIARPDFDLILMDLRMPVMDGYEATKVLRSRGVQTPIVALTAHVLKEDRDNARECGFTDYLTKPISRDDLISCLTNNL